MIAYDATLRGGIYPSHSKPSVFLAKKQGWGCHPHQYLHWQILPNNHSSFIPSKPEPHPYHIPTKHGHSHQLPFTLQNQIGGFGDGVWDPHRQVGPDMRRRSVSWYRGEERAETPHVDISCLAPDNAEEEGGSAPNPPQRIKNGVWEEWRRCCTES